MNFKTIQWIVLKEGRPAIEGVPRQIAERFANILTNVNHPFYYRNHLKVISPFYYSEVRLSVSLIWSTSLEISAMELLMSAELSVVALTLSSSTLNASMVISRMPMSC